MRARRTPWARLGLTPFVLLMAIYVQPGFTKDGRAQTLPDMGWPLPKHDLSIPELAGDSGERVPGN